MLKTKPILKEPARERKHQDGVANQLARRAPKKGEIVSHFVPAAGNVDETIKEIKAQSKPAKSTPAKPEVTKRMLSKIARAYKKAGTVKGGGTEPDHECFRLHAVKCRCPDPREKQRSDSESHQRRDRNRGPESQRSRYREESWL